MLADAIPRLSLVALEVILGIDNIISISILADKLTENQRNKLRYWGLGLVMFMLTAVGMTDHLWNMYTAVVISVLIILLASQLISEFIYRHPSFKILALCFLIVIAVALLSAGFEVTIPKGYISFSMAVALLVDVIQMRLSKKINSGSTSI